MSLDSLPQNYKLPYGNNEETQKREQTERENAWKRRGRNHACLESIESSCACRMSAKHFATRSSASQRVVTLSQFVWICFGFFHVFLAGPVCPKTKRSTPSHLFLSIRFHLASFSCWRSSSQCICSCRSFRSRTLRPFIFRFEKNDFERKLRKEFNNFQRFSKRIKLLRSLKIFGLPGLLPFLVRLESSESAKPDLQKKLKTSTRHHLCVKQIFSDAMACRLPNCLLLLLLQIRISILLELQHSLQVLLSGMKWKNMCNERNVTKPEISESQQKPRTTRSVWNLWNSAAKKKSTESKHSTLSSTPRSPLISPPASFCPSQSPSGFLTPTIYARPFKQHLRVRDFLQILANLYMKAWALEINVRYNCNIKLAWKNGI